MRVRALRHCDALLSERNKLALFEGQDYDLPDSAAQPLIDAGCVMPLEAKAVHGPPEDKAVEPAEDKAPPAEPGSLVKRVLRRKKRTRKTT